MKVLKKMLAIILAICLAAALFVGCSGGEDTNDNNAATPADAPATKGPEGSGSTSSGTRTIDRISFGGISFTPWNVDEVVTAFGVQDKKTYTIMLYLNGSDLESEGGMATGDLMEILESGFDEESINVVILTGGTLEWQNEVIPNDTCALYRVAEGDLELIDDIGQRSIGDAGTLSSFIDFGIKVFPAEKYGFIFWNHGGGSIAGYGVDENFDYDSLSLLEINYALEESLASENKLEFIGFDSCLMATIETAVIAQDYAKYLIASEELEPGYGWDYNWLADLSQNPDMSGGELGKVIVDKFTDFYADSGEDTTLSVTDLSKVNDVLRAMGTLMVSCNNDFTQKAFKQFAKSRSATKTFGGGSPRDNGCDMIDLVDMAYKLENNYPDEARGLIEAVEDAVLYSKNSDNVEGAYGLSTYYIFGGKDEAGESLEVYKSLVMNPHYTNFLANFASALTGESFAKIDISDEKPEENSEGDYTIKLTEEELENLLEIYFTVWEPVEGEPDYYFMLGQSSDVEIEEDGTVTTEFDGVWPGVNGDFVCLYEISNGQGGKKYAIPAVLNGEDVDIITVFDKKNPDGRIIGARPLTDGTTDMAAKNLLKIKKGDKIKFLYYAEYFGEDSAKELEEWYEGEEFTVKDELKLEMLEVNAGETYLYGFLLLDVQQNEYYTDFIEVEFLQ